MYHIIIPARYAAQRLPGKPLRDIAGKPLIQHVYERACQCQAKEVVIATDDERIAAVARDFGAIVCMTKASHPSGTDRIAEVIAQRGYDAQDVIVNMQGDEPMMPPQLIETAAKLCAEHAGADMITAAEFIHDAKDIFNPHIVKVVIDRHGYALYFSRAPIPWCRDAFAMSGVSQLPAEQIYRRHIGLYAYRAGFITQYVAWPRSELETLESLEQLRVLERGGKIVVFDAPCSPGFGIDTEDDLQRAIAVLTANES